MLSLLQTNWCSCLPVLRHAQANHLALWFKTHFVSVKIKFGSFDQGSECQIPKVKR